MTVQSKSLEFPSAAADEETAEGAVDRIVEEFVTNQHTHYWPNGYPRYTSETCPICLSRTS